MTKKWTTIDRYPEIQRITAEIVLVTCCGQQHTLYPDTDGGITCPVCGKEYRLRVTAIVQVRDRT